MVQTTQDDVHIVSTTSSRNMLDTKAETLISTRVRPAIRLRVGMLWVPPSSANSKEAAAAIQMFCPSASSASMQVISSVARRPLSLLSTRALDSAASMKQSRQERSAALIADMKAQIEKSQAVIVAEKPIRQTSLQESVQVLENMIRSVEEDISEISRSVGVGGMISLDVENSLKADDDAPMRDIFQEELDFLEKGFLGTGTNASMHLVSAKAHGRFPTESVVKEAEYLRKQIRELLNNLTPLLVMAKSLQGDVQQDELGDNNKAGVQGLDSEAIADQKRRVIDILTMVCSKIVKLKDSIRSVSDRIFGLISGSKSHAEVSAASLLLNSNCFR